MDRVIVALLAYGAKLTDDGRIERRGKVLDVRPVIKGRRLRFESVRSGNLIASGPISEKFVDSFVREFWFWEKDA